MLDEHFVINSTNIGDAVRRTTEGAVPEPTQIEIRLANHSQDGEAMLRIEIRGPKSLAKSIHIDEHRVKPIRESEDSLEQCQLYISELAARGIKVVHQAESDETEQEALDRRERTKDKALSEFWASIANIWADLDPEIQAQYADKYRKPDLAHRCERPNHGKR